MNAALNVRIEDAQIAIFPMTENSYQFQGALHFSVFGKHYKVDVSNGMFDTDINEEILNPDYDLSGLALYDESKNDYDLITDETILNIANSMVVKAVNSELHPEQKTEAEICEDAVKRAIKFFRNSPNKLQGAKNLIEAASALVGALDTVEVAA